MRRDVFQAIADPTRREILNLISKESLNINTVSGNFNVTRAAIYKHMKILTECGLVEITQYGRERFCEAKLERLDEVSKWIEQYKQFWASRFDNLDSYLDHLQKNKKKKQTERKK